MPSLRKSKSFRAETETEGESKRRSFFGSRRNSVKEPVNTSKQAPRPLTCYIPEDPLPETVEVLMAEPSLDMSTQALASSVAQPSLDLYKSAQVTQSTEAPVVIESFEKPVVVHETYHPLERTEVQPIIYREREQLDVRQVTHMLHETEIRPTIVEQRELPAEIRESVVERFAIEENIVLPSRDIEEARRTTLVHEPIVNEVIKRTIIEEVQPVLYKDIVTPIVIQQTQCIYEKVVEAPILIKEVRQVTDLGTRYVDMERTRPEFRDLAKTLYAGSASLGKTPTSPAAPVAL